MGRDFAERDRNQKATVCAAITIGIAMGFVLITNNIWRHPHPFQDMPQLLDPVTKYIFYPIHDPSFPSNSSCLTFAIPRRRTCTSTANGASFCSSRPS